MAEVIGNKIGEVHFQGNVEVEKTSTKVVAANENRNGLELVNESTAAIYLSLGTKAAEEKKGIFLAKEGGSWNGQVGPIVWTGEVLAISPSAKSILTVVEV